MRQKSLSVICMLMMVLSIVACGPRCPNGTVGDPDKQYWATGPNGHPRRVNGNACKESGVDYTQIIG